MAPKSYSAFCGKADNNPQTTEEDRREFAQLATANFDTTTANSMNEDELLKEVMMDVGPLNGMNGGLVTFMETPDVLGGTLQFLHGVSLHTARDANRNVAFVYYGDVEDGNVESIPFVKGLLAEADEVTTLDTMERLVTKFNNDDALDLVGPFADNAAHTKKIITRKCMFLPFALVLSVIGRNLTPRAAVQVLVPLMAALELVLPQLTHFLLAACTKAADNNPPVTVQDQTEVGLIHTRPRMILVDNARRASVLHRQLPALSPSGSDLGNSVAALTNISISTEGLRTSLERNINQRRLDIVEKAKPTSVESKFPYQFDSILKATGVEREEDLPEIWHQMANRKRDGEPLFSMLQTQVSKEANHFEQPAMQVTVVLSLIHI